MQAESGQILNGNHLPSSATTVHSNQELTSTTQYQRVLSKIIRKIRGSQTLDVLSSTTSQDICQLLGIERIAFYRFNEDWSGSFISSFGFAQSPWDKISAFGDNMVWADTHLQETKGGRYRKNDLFAVADIYQAGHARCHIELLEQFQVRAYAIAPLFVGTKLWGLLAAYQHSQPRQWQKDELEFLLQVSGYLGVAIQQAQLLAQAEQRETALQNAVARQRTLTEVVGNIRSSLDNNFVFQTTCRELCKLLKLERAAIYRFEEDWSGEFISHFGTVEPTWESANPFGKNLVWEDTHLQDTKGGRYRNNETFAVADIYEVGHSRCHLDILEQFKIRAYALVPIFIGPRLWGLLAAYHHSAPRQWEAYEVEFLAQVAAQLGVAIQQSELLARSQQRETALQDAMARQRALTEVVSKIRSSLDTKLILQTTCQEVCKLLKAERVAVYQFNEDWSGEFISHYGTIESQWESINPFGRNLVWEDTYLQDTKGGRYRNNETFAVTDIYEVGHSRCHLDILEQFKVRAYALTPIFVGRNLWGLLAAYQHSEPRQWDDVEVEFLSQVANQLGVAIQSADLLIETRTKVDKLHQAAQQRQILFDVVAKIRQSLDLETIFKITVQEVRQSLKADRAGVFRFNPDDDFCSGEFVSEDVLSEFDSALGIEFEDRFFGQRYALDYAQGQTQVICDLETAGLKNCYAEALERFQIKAQVVVPLMEGDKLWGLLCVHQCTYPRDWDEAEIKFVSQVAAQLSVALGQSNLLAQSREQAEKLAQTVEDLQKAQLQVIQSEKMASLGQLVAGVAHEINNPVGFIHGNLDHANEYVQELIELVKLYQKHYPETATEIKEFLKKADIDFLFDDVPKLFKSMQIGTERISEIVTSLRNFSRIDEAEFKAVNIHDGIDSTLMILQNRFKTSPDSLGIQVTKDYGALPLVECYPGQLNQVFMNLLANAIDALDEQNKQRSLEEIKEKPSKIRITTTVLDSDWIAVYIADNGAGIPGEILSQLFDPFFTTKVVGKGTGLGLSISYQIVTEKHGGKLYCNSSNESGTEFAIEIPVRQS